MIGDFFRNNMLIMLVIYAILFFMMGQAVILKLNRRSRLKMAKSLWLLAGYGFSHGINELVVIVMRVKEASLSPETTRVLHNTELGFKALSFMFIFWLGICLLTDYFERFRPLKWAGVAVSACWGALAVFALTTGESARYLAVADNLARYMFALPGFLMSGAGLWRQVREIERFSIPSLVTNLKGLSVTFFFGAFIVGAIANEPVLWPARIVNRHSFFDFVGVPTIFFRSIFLILTTYFVIRIVHVFKVEREYRLEEALRRQVLLRERERIGRELHDGIIQSIYGVGLKLEQVSLLSEKKPAEARAQLNASKEDLNRVIQDIRDYIQELQPEDFSCVSIREGISELVREYRESGIVQIELNFQGQQGEELNIIQINNILQILRELLTNAVKHSHAAKVQVLIGFGSSEMVIRYHDDGVGFDPAILEKENLRGEKQGLRNVFYRVGMMQGTVFFHTAPWQGSSFEITVPYKKLNYAGGVFADAPGCFIQPASTTSITGSD
jgi:signal transduction histidine kinase